MRGGAVDSLKMVLARTCADTIFDIQGKHEGQGAELWRGRPPVIGLMTHRQLPPGTETGQDHFGRVAQGVPR